MCFLFLMRGKTHEAKGKKKCKKNHINRLKTHHLMKLQTATLQTTDYTPKEKGGNQDTLPPKEHE